MSMPCDALNRGGRRCRPAVQNDSTRCADGTAALRDFDPAYVRFGSGAHITRLLSNVRFTPQKRTKRRHVGMSASCHNRTHVRPPSDGDPGEIAEGFFAAENGAP